MVAETPTTPRWGRGEKGTVQQGVSSSPTPSGGIRALPGETRRGAATPKAPHNKKSGAWEGEGFRVFRVKANRETRRALRRFYKRLCSNDPTLPKNAKLYLESWEKQKATVLEMRKRAGKRTPPKRDPAFYLKVKLVKDGRRIHGSDGAPVVIDLTEGELRIPCVGIRVPLKPSLLQALEEDLRLNPKPEFIVQLRYNGKLRIIARRTSEPWWLYREESDDFSITRIRPPVRVLAMDLNSRYGLAVVVFDIDSNGVRVPTSPFRLQPPNETYYDELAAVAQKIAQGLPPTPPRDATEEERQRWEWALARVKRLEKEAGALTTERADRLYRLLLRSARIARQLWARKVVRELRRFIREANGRAVIAIDAPNPESLKYSDLQKTYLRVAKLVRNLCAYEGAYYRRVRASGRVCPLCDQYCEEVAHRYYRCPQCNLIFDRDYGASFNAALKVLPPTLAEELREWLRKHPKALAPNYGNKPAQAPNPTPGPTSRDTRPDSTSGGRSRGPARAMRV
ncbi:MAG: zinc ribbon domain-containing protein [Sulfolobales archaeon]